MTTTQSDLQTIRRPCKVITIQEKLAILRQLEAGTSRREVELMFNCSQSTISRILSGKETIVEEAQNNTPGRRDNLLIYKELDVALAQWAKEMKMTDGVITASVAKQKAEELCRAMGYDLKPSTAWLYKWKERENIKFAKKTKDPDEILRDFLEKREKSRKERHKINGQSFKRIKLTIPQSKLKVTEDKATKGEDLANDRPQNHTEELANDSLRLETHEQAKEIPQDNPQKSTETQPEQNLPNDSLQSQLDESKPRIKREYVKRLPIVDASGIICRSRKEKTFLTLLQKLEILQRLKNGERRSDLIVEYKLSQSAMSQIVTDEEKILKLAAGGQNLQMKRIRGGIFKGGEAELNAWVKEKMDIGESLTRSQIKNHAKEIAERLKIDFKASTGWLEKWKARMNLDFNENQVLMRKVPIPYIPNEEEFDNSFTHYEQPDVVYDQHSDMGDSMGNQIKEEFTENDDYGEEMISNDEFSYEEMPEADIKPELLSPEQFYLQTIKNDSVRKATPTITEQQPSTTADDEEEEEEQDCDVKPFIGTPPHVQEREATPPQPSENLHEQVLHWFTRHNIPPIAAMELLNILHPHLNKSTTTNSSTVQQKRQYF